MPVKNSVSFFYLFDVLNQNLFDIGVENLISYRILDGIRQLINLNANLYFFCFFHSARIQSKCLKCLLKGL